MQLDSKLARSNARELHHKSKLHAEARNFVLAEARAALQAGRAAGHGTFDGPWEPIYETLRTTYHVQRRFGECARLWGLLSAFLRGKPYAKLERNTKTNKRRLAFELARLATEVIDDVAHRRDRNSFLTTEVHWALIHEIEPRIIAWLKESV